MYKIQPMIRSIFLGLLLLTGIVLSAQRTDKEYNSRWKRVDSFSAKGLPKSALNEVLAIYKLAKKENLQDQLVKSLVYRINLQEETRESNLARGIPELENEIRLSAPLPAALLQNITATAYWNYYRNNRYKYYSRTTTVNYNSADLETWSAEDILKKVQQLYLSSLKNERLLQQTSLSNFEAIIIKGNTRHLRPTLYDLLAQEALKFFESGDIDINNPVYTFELDQADAFGNLQEFLAYNFKTRDSLSSKHKAIQLYQKLLAFHAKDTKPDALIDLDIQRLRFVYQNSVHPEKEKLYFRAMENITLRYGKLPASNLASYYMAQWYQQKGASFKPYGDSTNYRDLVKAREICRKLLQQKDSSEGKYRCQQLLMGMERAEMSFNVEKVNSPALDMRAFIKYRNLSALYFRVIPVTKTLKEELKNQYLGNYWKKIAELPVIKSWAQPLPLPDDLQQHAAEIRVEALSSGEYLLLASSDSNMRSSEGILGAAHFYVSSISFIHEGSRYYVLNRETGAPLKQAGVKVTETTYNYSTSKNEISKETNYTTDEHGFFRINEPKQNGSYYSTYNMSFTYDNDKLELNDAVNDYYYRTDPPDTASDEKVFLFTDRSIYRPGQWLYFKGIVISKGLRKAVAEPGYENWIYLRNTDEDNIDSLKITSNDFGSFQGKFRLPNNGLTGEFSLQMQYDEGESSFRVEEYKRPKFQVSFLPVKTSFRLNETIVITGEAKAYAGNNIDGAKVSYRVQRVARFPYPWMYRRWWQPPSSSMEITNGEVVTDKDGKFRISFQALPDLSIDPKFEPVFDYSISTDVTDINGETRSASENVSIGYKALQLRVVMPTTLPADSFHNLSLFTSNMAGEFQKAQVTVIITRMLPPQRLIRERYWTRPDQFTMSKEDYIRYFPNDEYDNETDPESWPIERNMLSREDTSRQTGQWDIQYPIKPGYYEVLVKAYDPVKKEEVKDIRYIELTGKELPMKYLSVLREKLSGEPGEKAFITMGTAANDVHLISEISRQDKTKNELRYDSLNHESKTFTFPIEENDRGGFGTTWFFVKNNRVFSNRSAINVSWKNKELDIRVSSFRDKTLPGAKETWKLEISGYNKEKMAAEMLASMYDMSLDQFYPHNWSVPYLWEYFTGGAYWSSQENFKAENAAVINYLPYTYWPLYKEYDNLLTVDAVGRNRIYRTMKRTESPAPIVSDQLKNENALEEVVVTALGIKKEKKVVGFITDSTTKDAANLEPNSLEPAAIRKNFNETAFFYPDLKTDSIGNISFTFTMPEALTRWKFQAIAHSKDASFGYTSKEIVTQKELMVQPNPPRFLREGDKMELNAKIVNLSDKEFTGIAELQLFNAATNETVDGWFRNMIPKQFFTVAAGQSDIVKFPIEVPYLFNSALQWRVIAKTDQFSDGEENNLPILSNRMLVTESMPLQIRGDGTKNYSFDKLKNADSSGSLQHQSITVEYTSNPVWYAVQSLPYLMEYPYECAEQSWNRYYANSLASWLVSSSPRIRQVFSKWKELDTAALMSNLEKNQELKAILLEETPWVLAARNESQQKKNLALLFDMTKMADELGSAYSKFSSMQSTNGGFVWFSGGPDDRYITQYILTGIGHLLHLNAVSPAEKIKLGTILDKAIPYLDQKIKEQYDELVKRKVDLKNWTPDQYSIQYLYMRSFFTDKPIPDASRKAFDLIKTRLAKTWTGNNKYMQAMIALGLNRFNEKETPGSILRSLKETAIISEEMGMYYKDQSYGWWWYQAPVETQALVIEAFDEIAKDSRSADDLRTWLIKNKQTNHWGTTVAPAEACYAILLRGTQWLENNPAITIQLGSTTLNSNTSKQEEGTGYFKTVIEGKDVRSDMGTIKLTVKTNSREKNTAPSWGSVYWQYFEDLDKITPSSSPLSLKKKLFIEKNSDRGPVLHPVNEGDVIHVGDKIKVRIELRVDRPMEYVHMKDMRASSLEPQNVLSNYKWQGGLGYYESTRDASTNFFISYLPKGTFVFEYTLFATHAGNFSNGVTSIQCMYAPEFGAHSEGVRIDVEE